MTTTPPRTVLDSVGLARALGVGVGTIDDMRKSGRIPVVIVGQRTYRYDLAAVLAALTMPAGGRVTGAAAQPSLCAVDEHDGSRNRAHRAGADL